MPSSSSEIEPALVVSAVDHEGEALLLVEDTWMTDSESAAPASRRTWVAASGAETTTTTTTSTLSSDPAHTLATAVTDALVSAALDRAISEGASRDAMHATVRQATTAGGRAEPTALLIDGVSRAGLIVTQDGTVVCGAVVGATFVLVVSGSRGVALTLEPVA